MVILGIAMAAPAGCGKPATPPAISLVRLFSDAEIVDSPKKRAEFRRLEWRFDGTSTIPAVDKAGPLAGWTALSDLEDLAIWEGQLVGRVSGEFPIIAIAIPEKALPKDLLGALEVKIRASAGTRLGVLTSRRESIDLEDVLKELEDSGLADLQKEFQPGDEIRTVRFTDADSPFTVSTALRTLKHLALVLFEAEGAEIAIESVRLLPRNEVLAGIPAGVSWQGLGGIFRETIVSRAPERIVLSVALGERPWLELAFGSPDFHAATYHVEVEAAGAKPLTRQRTVTHADEWHELAMPLDALAGRQVTISLTLEAEREGQVGFWGTPTVRHRGASPTVAEPTEARVALGPPGPPRGVILIVADTLRSDHLDAWGYERSTAPNLTRLAREGTILADNISQGAWTKVSISSILSSLYPTTHGVYDIPHRLPASVTTLAEAFREAGYATFHTSSVTFSGRNSNLQQGVEVLHERFSVDNLGDYRSKTARVYMDRLLPWLDKHRDEPFFVFLHVFDPHSPFRPFDPYDRRWLSDGDLGDHEENLKKVEEVVDVFHGLPTAEELEKAGGIEAEAFVRAEKAWYDGSIRAMDAEIRRLIEKLGELELLDDTLLAFVSDHGEEFLEHGRHWHGHSVYGEMINVPMLVRWPGVVPAGRIIEQTTQSIDLMPTILELAQLPVPEAAQGRSLVPLMAADGDPGRFGWLAGPVFSERREPPGEADEGSPDAYAVIHDGWKLIWNVERRDERPEFELFDHANDPLNLSNVAEVHPDRVAQLHKLIEDWRKDAEASRMSDEGLEESLSPEDLEQLRALGYVN
jgi:arylsulfatase A-like enzyme